MSKLDRAARYSYLWKREYRTVRRFKRPVRWSRRSLRHEGFRPS